MMQSQQSLASLREEYLRSLLAGERHVAQQAVMEALEWGVSMRDLYLEVFQYAQVQLGVLWEEGKITVAHEHFCTAATQLIMSQLYPRIFANKKHGRVMVATSVAGNLHELGIRMVADFFEMDGWHTFYLGANTPDASVVAMLLEKQADLLAVSASMESQVQAVAQLIAAVRQDPALAKVRILVGGPPFQRHPETAMDLGADGTSPDPEQAVALANQIVEAAA